MTKSTLPLLLAGGAAILLLGGKRRVKTAKQATRPTVDDDLYRPAEAPIEKPLPPTSFSDQEIGQMLLELGYQDHTPTSIMEFQKDWNEMMAWLWKYNPNISKNTPNYGSIDIDGQWGKQTESRAVRALKNVPPGGADVNFGNKIIRVHSFRDMVKKSWSKL